MGTKQVAKFENGEYANPFEYASWLVTDFWNWLRACYLEDARWEGTQADKQSCFEDIGKDFENIAAFLEYLEKTRGKEND